VTANAELLLLKWRLLLLLLLLPLLSSCRDGLAA
jgi:hypothetical protein